MNMPNNFNSLQLILKKNKLKSQEKKCFEEYYLM